MDPLDNIVWHSLTGPHAGLAEGSPLARRYPEAIGPFFALPDEPDRANWDALRELAGPGQVATLFRADITTPDGFDEMFRFPGVQMVGPADVNSARDPRVEVLNPADVDEMLDLVARAKPGPFGRRTIELGTYLGIRVEGHLVAMAGQRVRTDQLVEISAVCTDEAWRGRGLAATLVTAQLAEIATQGARGFLHAATTNTGAIALYERLGFTHRRLVVGASYRMPR